MSSCGLFNVASVRRVADVLGEFGVGRGVLESIERGSVAWFGYDHRVHVSVDSSEVVAPYTVEVRLVDGTSEDETLMATGALGTDLTLLHAEFGEGLPADASDFARYVAASIASTRSEPEFIVDDLDAGNDDLSDDWDDEERE